MKKFKILLLTVLATFLVAGSALALPLTALQGVVDGITVAPVSGDSSVDVENDMIADSSDSYWSITGSGGSVATMIVELAGFADQNIFGVYSDGKYIALFDGGSAANAQVLLSIELDGSVYVNFGDSGIDFAANNFGFYLDSSANKGGGLFHSDTTLNGDNVDHMFAYAGLNIDTVQIGNKMPGLWTNNEYILAFEDLNNGGDLDYTDMVLMIESVNPVPEPATMLLFGMGLLGLAGITRRKK